MKKFIATIAIIGSAATLSACETSGNFGDVDTAPPYADERTATHATHMSPAPMKKVVKAAPAPVSSTVVSETVFREIQSK